MKNRMIVTAMALVFCASVARAETGAIAVGAMQLVPTITLSEYHNDNILSKKKKKEILKSWVTVIKPRFALSADNGADQYTFVYDLSDKIYHQSHDDDVVGHFFKFDAKLGLSRKLTSDFYIDYKLSHDPRGSTFTGGAASTVVVPDAYHESILGGSVDYGSNAHIIVKGEYSSKRYTNNRIRTVTRDMDTATAAAEFDYHVTGKTSAVLEARYKQFNYQYQTARVNLDSNEQKYFVGLNWDATAKTSGTVRVGYAKKSFSNVSIQDSGFLAWEVIAKWRPMSYSSWVLRTSSLPVETDGTGSYIKNTGVDLAWSHAWSGRVRHRVSFAYTKASYQGSTRTDDVTKARVSVAYQWQRWLAIQPSYDYRRRLSNVKRASYKSNVWMMSFVGRL